jgi:hypothetical protein
MGRPKYGGKVQVGNLNFAHMFLNDRLFTSPMPPMRSDERPLFYAPGPYQSGARATQRQIWCPIGARP